MLIAASKATFKLAESRNAMNAIKRYAADDAHVIFGTAYDESLADQLRVTVIATGLSSATVLNPTLTLPEGRERNLEDDDEGCLSLPGAFVECPRPDWAAVDGFGLDGQPVHFEGDGLLARCLQHETDHTIGTVFGDRLPTKARKKLQKAHDKTADDYPATWPTDLP